MKDRDVKCPNCKRIFFKTTDKYDPDIPPNGSMVRSLLRYHLDWLPIRTTTGAEMTCPECLAPLVTKGKLWVIAKAADNQGVGLDAVIADGVEMPTVENEEKFTCPTCGKVCKNQFGLTGHMRSHAE